MSYYKFILIIADIHYKPMLQNLTVSSEDDTELNLQVNITDSPCDFKNRTFQVLLQLTGDLSTNFGVVTGPEAEVVILNQDVDAGN